MADDFSYKPRFKDMRIRPPKAGEEDVRTLKDGERPCEWPECLKPATARAPKSRENLESHYHFCQPHAGEYNKRWNFFEGMSEAQQQQFREDAQTGHRPTWAFKASRLSREAAAFAAKVGSGAEGKGSGAYADAFGVFSDGSNAAGRAAPKFVDRQMGRLEARAMQELDLDSSADGGAIRAKYLDLVKRFHPDTNGGDRSTEVKLQRVIRAYKTLQKAKLTK